MLGALGHRVGLAHVGEQAEVLELAGGDGVAREQQAPWQHGPESVEEEVQVAERRAQQPRPGHPELRVAADHREVGHQRELEPTSERVRLDLRDRDLREAQVVVVEAEGLTVDAEAAPLAGPALRLASARTSCTRCSCRRRC